MAINPLAKDNIIIETKQAKKTPKANKNRGINKNKKCIKFEIFVLFLRRRTETCLFYFAIESRATNPQYLSGFGNIPLP